jgi:RNA polymerase-binding protein DksA
MAATTARTIAGRTAAAARRVTGGVTRRGAGAKKTASPAKKAATKKTATAKTAAKKTVAKKAAPKKAAPKKGASKKTPTAKKSATTQKAPTARRAAATKPATKKAATKKAATKKPATKATATKTPAKKAPATRTPSAKKAAVKKAAVKKTPAKTTSAKKTSAKAGAATRTVSAPATQAAVKKTAPKTATRAAARKLAVKADEKPWTTKELDEVRGDLNADRERLRSELNLAEVELHDLMRDAGDGAGNDQADVGSTTFERDHEMSLANNARVMLAQTERALARIENGTYGVCESCGQPIGKNRLMAFPRATLCLSCKQREERR